jgi:hypothetical protein
VADGDGPGAKPSGKEPEGDFARTERLLLDELSERLDTLKLLRADSDQAADAALEQFGARGKVEAQMLDQLSARTPLRYPDRFEEAHRTAIRALEVFDRNGARAPSSLKAGVLTPVASFFVQLLIRLIVRSYQSTVIDQIRDLYARREAESEKGSPEFGMLRLARFQVERLTDGFRKKTGGLPTFLLGGAALSAVASSLQGLFVNAVGNRLLLLVVAAVFVAIALAAFWCILTAAAIARRRTRIALDQPLRALWEVMGAAGHPPHDQSRQFAIYAVILLVLAWIVVPVAIVIAIASG